MANPGYAQCGSDGLQFLCARRLIRPSGDGDPFRWKETDGNVCTVYVRTVPGVSWPPLATAERDPATSGSTGAIHPANRPPYCDTRGSFIFASDAGGSMTYPPGRLATPRSIGKSIGLAIITLGIYTYV